MAHLIQTGGREGGSEGRTDLSVWHSEITRDGRAEGEDEGIHVRPQVLYGHILSHVGIGYKLNACRAGGREGGEGGEGGSEWRVEDSFTWTNG